MKYVFVVTSTEMGWDCVCGVYEKSTDAYHSCFERDSELTIEQMIDTVECGDTSYVVSAKKLQ